MVGHQAPYLGSGGVAGRAVDVERRWTRFLRATKDYAYAVGWRARGLPVDFHVRGGSLFLAPTDMDKGTPHCLQTATRCLVPCKTNAFSASTIFTFAHGTDNKK